MGGFPTLFLFPGKSKGTPILYQGARETEDLKEFIMENVSTAVLCLTRMKMLVFNTMNP